ncbi:hypothetical protein C8R45DRAFT_371051 [Mycena sanguinolenta]|nr:hypothetical protein C8R45DRAFT_371051 [Mycena sanguinolenta]
MIKDGKPSEAYVRDVRAKITENAAAKFWCMQREYTHCAGAKSHTAISNELSSTLNNLELGGWICSTISRVGRGIVARNSEDVGSGGAHDVDGALAGAVSEGVVLELGCGALYLQVWRERLERRFLPFCQGPCKQASRKNGLKGYVLPRAGRAACGACARQQAVRAARGAPSGCHDRSGDESLRCASRNFRRLGGGEFSVHDQRQHRRIFMKGTINETVELNTKAHRGRV